MRRLSLFTVTGLVAAGLTLSACGSNSLSTPPAAGSAPAGSASAAGGGVDQALAAKVPAKLKSAGKIVVGTDPTYAPNEMLATDGKTVEGFDVDLFNAVAAKLGLKTEYVPAGFGTIILGVTSGKYDMGVSSFTINPDRKKQVNMVSYYKRRHAVGRRQGQPREGQHRTTPAARASAPRRAPSRPTTSRHGARSAPTPASRPSRRSSRPARTR